MDLDKDTLTALSQSIGGYFLKQNLGKAIILAPHLADKNNLPCMGVTGLIRITGVINGFLYYTASVALLETLLSRLHLPNTPGYAEDHVGEMANIFAGNLRRQLDGKFEISSPFLIRGKIDQMSYPTSGRPYVLPFQYGTESSMIVVGFDELI